MNNDERLKEAERLVREHGVARYSDGVVVGARGPRPEPSRCAKAADVAFVALLSHLQARPLPVGEVTGLASFTKAQALAERFHEAYERLAPGFGYTTRPETRALDLQSANGRLMVAVCQELLAASPIEKESALPVQGKGEGNV